MTGGTERIEALLQALNRAVGGGLAGIEEAIRVTAGELAKIEEAIRDTVPGSGRR